MDPTAPATSFCGGFAAGLALGDDVVGAARRGCATAAAAIGAAGSLRLLDLGPVARDLLAGGEAAETDRAGPGVTGGSRSAGPRAAVSVSGNPAAPGAAADRPGQTGAGSPGEDDAYGIEVMHREIATIPDVIASSLADPGGHVQELADWLAGRGIEHLYLTGCGDSAFAGLAASLAFRRHSRLRVPPRARAGPGPLSRPLPAARQRRPGDLLLGEGRPHHRGRPPGGRIRAPGDRADQQPRWPAGRRPPTGSCPSTCPRSASPRAPAPISGCCARSSTWRCGPHGPAATGRSAVPVSSCPVRRPRRSTGATPRRPAPRPGWRPRVRHLPGCRAERGHGPLRRRETLRGVAADRRRHQHRGVGARGVLRHRGR